MYKCPNCHGEMVFSPEKQKLVCEYCDSEFSVEQFEKITGIRAEEYHVPKDETAENAQEGDPSADRYYQATVFTCPQCGGELISTEDTAATFCSFCGSSVLLESRVSRELKPDYIIPFRQSREDCRAVYKKMMAKAWFAPSAMKKETQIEKFRSIYMPYWIYSFDYEGPLTVKGETSTRRGDYIYTKHYNLNSRLKLRYDGIAYDASSSFSDNLSLAVAPFDLRQSDAFHAAYMTGHYADTRDTDALLYQADALQAVKEHAAGQMENDPQYAKHGADADDIADALRPKTREIRLGFFPVWFLASRNKKGDRVSYAVVNGQTGKIAADLPVDFLKYLLGSLLIAVPVFLLLSFVLNLTMTPRTLLLVTMVLGIISLMISNRQLNLVYTRENNLDDAGWLSRHTPAAGAAKSGKTKQKKKSDNGLAFGLIIWIGMIAFMYLAGQDNDFAFLVIALVIAAMVVLFIVRKVQKKNPQTVVAPAPAKEKLPVLLKPLTGVLLSLVIVLINPFEDTIPYAAAIAALALIVWSFADIIRSYNRLTERKLPQLGRRGGDENA